MRILSVAKSFNLLSSEDNLTWKGLMITFVNLSSLVQVLCWGDYFILAFFERGREPLGDGTVVRGSVAEGLQCIFLAVGKWDSVLTILELVKNATVVSWIAHHQYCTEVLGCRAEQRDSADVNLLHDVVLRDTLSAHRLHTKFRLDRDVDARPA